MTSLREIISWGYNRGYRMATDCDLIDIGNYVDRHIMGESENVKVTTQNWLDVHTNIAWDCETHNREFSPFEFTAHAINQYEYEKENGDAWLEFEEAIGRGISRALRERWKSIAWTKKDYAKSFDGSIDLFNACWRKLLAYSKGSEVDFNQNIEVERLLEEFASELVNDSSSRFYIYG
jgi:hypothetical protein